MQTIYYKISEAAKLLTPVVPGASQKQMENYLYSRVGKTVSAKIEEHPITKRKDISIPKEEIERLKNEFKKRMNK